MTWSTAKRGLQPIPGLPLAPPPIFILAHRAEPLFSPAGSLLKFGVARLRLALMRALLIRHPAQLDRASRPVSPAASPDCGPVILPHHASSDRKSTRLNSSHLGISYAVFCLK